MKYMKTFLILAIAILGFSTVNVQAQRFGDDRSVSRQSVERRVLKEITNLPYYGVFDFISFKVDGSVVTLFGKVIVPRNKRDAERAVREIAGVSSVVNNIEILPPSPYDARIRGQILRIFAEKGLSNYLGERNPPVRIIVHNGHVNLIGFVINRGDYNLMNIVANGVWEVFTVQNNLVIGKEQVR